MLQAVRLRCEYQENPIGLFTAVPRLSWILESDGSNVMQTTYELEAARDERFVRPVWRTGEVASAKSIQIPYGGEKLDHSTMYFWRVRIADNQGNRSEWSETACFETAMAPDGWKGVFISAEDENAGGSSAGTLLRKEFTVREGLKSARAYATAKGIYQLFCNGFQVGDEVLAPGWTEYGQRLLYQTYDVTGLLQRGGNAIGAMVGPGWYKGELASWLGKRNIYGSRTAVLVQLRLEYEDGSVEEVATDESWRCSASPVLYSEIYHGETYDARLEQPGWCRSGFDDGSWHSAMVESAEIVQVCPRDGLPVRAQEVFRPLSVFTTPEGEQVIDFGQNLSGWVRFRVRGKAGDRVVLRHGETLDAAGNFYTANLRRAKQRVEYILRGEGEETYSPCFTFQGFRYAAVDEYPGEIRPECFEAVSICSDLRQAGEFSCSHPLLNQLISNVRWSMKDNYVDVPTDCPQRDERLGWTGDAQVFVRAASYLMETAPFYRKWLRDVSAAQLENGSVAHVVPNVLQNIGGVDEIAQSDTGSTGWGDVITVAPWTLYKYFGDRDILEEQYPAMKRWVEFIRSQAEQGLIWNSGFHFGDWVALDAKEGSYFGATPNDLTATAYYAYSTRLLAKAAAVLGRKEDQAEYEALYGSIAKAYSDEFFTPSGRLAARTQTAHILSLVFGLTPAPYVKRTIDTLAELLEENGGHLTTGFLGTPYICQALSENGRLDLAYELLLKEDYPSWLYQITKGATTIWEHWDGLKPDGTMWSTDMNSFNHYAYGAVADWIFSTISGIDADESEPGFARIRMAPKPGGSLTWARVSYQSGYGEVSLYWKKENGLLHLEVKVPHNAQATLVLPEMEHDCELSGIAFQKGPDGVGAKLGSGVYSFSYSY